jgi:hypothetical protein
MSQRRKSKKSRSSRMDIIMVKSIYSRQRLRSAHFFSQSQRTVGESKVFGCVSEVEGK